MKPGKKWPDLRVLFVPGDAGNRIAQPDIAGLPRRRVTRARA
jgi:hypothetical protein